MKAISEAQRRRANTFWKPLARAAFDRPLTQAEISIARTILHDVNATVDAQLSLGLALTPCGDEKSDIAGKRYSPAPMHEGNSDPDKSVVSEGRAY